MSSARLEVPGASFVIKPTFVNKYSGILLSTFIHVYTISRFFNIYSILSVFINVQLEKKKKERPF